MAAFIAMGNYCSTKVFLTYLIQMVSLECSSKIDALSFNPAWVPSNMTDEVIKEKEKESYFNVAPVYNAVDGAMRALGRETITMGATRHELLLAKMYLFVPGLCRF